MLKAHCWRYMSDSSYDFCFPAGKILDEFEKILRSVREKTLSKDTEPEISTTLFHLGEKFYDHFDAKIETYFRESSGMHVKIVSETNRQTFLPHIIILVQANGGIYTFSGQKINLQQNTKHWGEKLFRSAYLLT